tara:strand:- start:8234 stop:8581 length:348 start_codon:yes stop_codon:yes gene_type:complete
MARPGPKSRIDPDQLRVLWGAGVPTAVIAKTFSASDTAVRRAAQQCGLPRRPRGAPSHVGAKKREPVPEPSAPRPLTGIAATGGRYAELAAYAEAEGITLTRAQQEWHRYRAGAA